MHLFLMVAAWAAIFSVTTLAADNPTQGTDPSPPAGATANIAGQSWRQLDADHDGAISRAEAAQQPHLVERWKELDGNHDDRLDQNELSGLSNAR